MKERIFWYVWFQKTLPVNGVWFFAYAWIIWRLNHDKLFIHAFIILSKLLVPLLCRSFQVYLIVALYVYAAIQTHDDLIFDGMQSNLDVLWDGGEAKAGDWDI